MKTKNLQLEMEKGMFDSWNSPYTIGRMLYGHSSWMKIISGMIISQLGFVTNFLLSAELDDFFPIGIYGVHEKADLELAHEAGFNCVVATANRDLLNTAQKLGLRVIASPGSTSGASFNVDSIRETVQALDHHPSLHSWYLVDEPDMQRIPPWKVEMDQRILKSIPAKKPVSLVLYHGMHVKDYGFVPDVLMLDYYPVPWMPLAHFAQHLYWARNTIELKKPIYAVLQAFDWHYFKHLVPGEKNLRTPTIEELRCMTYMSLAQGMNGLFYYTLQAGEWDLLKHPELWSGLQEVIRSLNDNQYLLNAQRKWWLPRYKITPFELRRNASLEPSISMTMLEDAKGLTHLLFINTTPNELTLTVTLPGSSNRWAPVFEGKSPFGGLQPDATYNFTFNKYQVRLLKGFENPSLSNWLE